MSDRPPSLAHALPLATAARDLRGADEAALHASLDDLLARATDTEPALRALLPEEGRRERLMREASDLVRRWPDPPQRPPLFGVPVGVKDIIAVDGLPTRAGSALPSEAFETAEAPIVRSLRGAGALVFGKTVTAEFASMTSNATANPHDTRHTPGGSSSGSTAGVAAGYFPLALGTQTGGSVIRPAAFCGVVGFKPSYGRIPTEGVVAHAISVDTVGLFTQDMAGMALAATALIEGWRSAPPPQPSPARGEGAGVRNLRVVVPDGAYLELASPEGRQCFEDAVTRVAAAGVSVRRAPFLDDVEDVLARHSRLMEAEFAAEHRERFARWGTLYSGGAAEAVDRGSRVSGEALAEALAGRGELRERVAAFLDDHEADAIVCPSAVGPAPRGLRSTGDPKMNAPWTHAGVPAITLPAGAVDGLPVGLQLIGRFGADEELVAIACALEGVAASV